MISIQLKTTLKTHLWSYFLTKIQQMHFFLSSNGFLSHTYTLASQHSTSSQLCINMIQIEHLSTAQVTHIHTTALYKDHYINTALAIRNTTETSIHTPHAVISRAEQDDRVSCMEQVYIHTSTVLRNREQRTGQSQREASVNVFTFFNSCVWVPQFSFV